MLSQYILCLKLNNHVANRNYVPGFAIGNKYKAKRLLRPTSNLWSSTNTYSLTTIIIDNRGCAMVQAVTRRHPIDEAQV
jgi:hypothetical protein